jgi:hypothetical protein
MARIASALEGVIALGLGGLLTPVAASGTLLPQ